MGQLGLIGWEKASRIVDGGGADGLDLIQELLFAPRH